MPWSFWEENWKGTMNGSMTPRDSLRNLYQWRGTDYIFQILLLNKRKSIKWRKKWSRWKDVLSNNQFFSWRWVFIIQYWITFINQYCWLLCFVSLQFYFEFIQKNCTFLWWSTWYINSCKHRIMYKTLQAFTTSLW